ncbi:hypothetical protein G6F35_016043 [Rhizopus arrhizus]|nr:hypothetical protein G6F35_016043 [Rhizopus arrhizus]
MTGTPSAAMGARRARAAGNSSTRSVLFRMMSGEMPALQAPASARPVRSSEKVGRTAITISNWSTLDAN